MDGNWGGVGCEMFSVRVIVVNKKIMNDNS